jgi:hypothetical protein
MNGRKFKEREREREREMQMSRGSTANGLGHFLQPDAVRLVARANALFVQQRDHAGRRLVNLWDKKKISQENCKKKNQKGRKGNETKEKYSKYKYKIQYTVIFFFFFWGGGGGGLPCLGGGIF